MSSSNVLVTGGAGFIGSHTVKMLVQHGYRPIVLDNLSVGDARTVTQAKLVQGDLAHPEDLNKIFANSNIQAVMHFAALIDVGESVRDPARYYINNVAYTINLLESMRRFQVKTLVFSSTAAIFGLPQQPKIGENHPCHPINPYGQSKLIIEKILKDYDCAYGIKSCSLRYFNAAGGDPEGKIRNYKQKETNLIPLILRSLKQTKPSPITIFGTDYPTPDGTCIRDYVHIEDLGSAHILAMEKLLKEQRSTHYNLGNGHGFSVREVIKTAEQVTDLKVDIIEGARRPGDPPILVADSHHAQLELGWIPRYSDLSSMITHAWKALQSG